MDRSLPVAAAIVTVVLMCYSGLCRANRLGARECEGLGFTGLALCSDCNALSECEGLGFTWEGPGGVVEGQLDPAAPAIDPNDPNYEEQEEGGGAAEDEAVDREVVVGEVEVAESRDGVARVDVALLQEQNQ